MGSKMMNLSSREAGNMPQAGQRGSKCTVAVEGGMGWGVSRMGG